MIESIKQQVTQVTEELVETAGLKAGDIFVVGASSSEVLGKHIGKGSSQEVGQAIVSAVLSVLKPRGIYLAEQCCEHLNRALVIEREAGERYGLEEVSVVPALHAGGACAVAAYEQFEDPMMVEFVTAKAGLDIGDTLIGMHLKHVAVPVRLQVKSIGEAHLTAARTRPKLIGGQRAQYQV